MEQGSSNSNQRKYSFTDELHEMMNGASQQELRYSIPETNEYRSSNLEDSLNYSQSNQPQQIGSSSFSTTPLQEYMQQSQFDGSNVDLSAYLQSNDYQLLQGNQSFTALMQSGEEVQYEDQTMNRYNLSSSNYLPNDFHILSSSSALQRGQIGSSQTLVPFESAGIESPATVMNNAYPALLAQNNAMMPNHNALVPFRFAGSHQDLPYGPYPLSTPNGFDFGTDISNNGTNLTPSPSQLQVPNFGSSMNVPLITDGTTTESSLRLTGTQAIPYGPYPLSAPNGFDLGTDISNNGKNLIPTPQSQVPNLGRSMNVPLLNDSTIVESSLRLPRNQGIPYAKNNTQSGGGFDLVNLPSTSRFRVPYSFGSSMNVPLFNDGTTTESSLRAQGVPYAINNTQSGGGFDPVNVASSSRLKRKMPLQDDITPSWNPSGRIFNRYSSSSYNGGRYTLYDKRYEDVGLHVDPHLRIFVASNGNGNGASSSKSKD